MRDDDPDLVPFYPWSRVHGIVMLLLACDPSGVVETDVDPQALSLFRQTRAFVLDGLRR